MAGSHLLIEGAQVMNVAKKQGEFNGKPFTSRSATLIWFGGKTVVKFDESVAAQFQDGAHLTLRVPVDFVKVQAATTGDGYEQWGCVVPKLDATNCQIKVLGDGESPAAAPTRPRASAS